MLSIAVGTRKRSNLGLPMACMAAERRPAFSVYLVGLPFADYFGQPYSVSSGDPPSLKIPPVPWALSLMVQIPWRYLSRMRSPLSGANFSTAVAHFNFVTALGGLDQRHRGTGSVLTVNVKPSSNGFRDVESAGVWRHPEMRAISRLHVRTIATRLRLLRRTAAQEKMNAGGTAWHQHGADTRFLSCPDADTRHRPHLIIHDALQGWPVPATLSAAGGPVRALMPSENPRQNE